MQTNAGMVYDFILKADELRTDAGLDEVNLSTQMTMIREEMREVEEALASGDEVELAKELVDLLYVVYGAAHQICDVDMLFETVHLNNMSKLDGAKFREDGKLLKPKGFKKLTREDISVWVD